MAQLFEQCSICYSGQAKYHIQCPSEVPHVMCHSCESDWRMKSIPDKQHNMRVLTCPFCRAPETKPGLRSRTSYENEIASLYSQLLHKPDRLQYLRQLGDQFQPLHVNGLDQRAERQHVQPVKQFCMNRHVGCSTFNKTQRKCSYPAGCDQFVCRQCKMCFSHFN